MYLIVKFKSESSTKIIIRIVKYFMYSNRFHNWCLTRVSFLNLLHIIRPVYAFWNTAIRCWMIGSEELDLISLTFFQIDVWILVWKLSDIKMTNYFIKRLSKEKNCYDTERVQMTRIRINLNFQQLSTGYVSIPQWRFPPFVFLFILIGLNLSARQYYVIWI